jgi:uncharacterized protein YndB with AHSA1/START domain
MKRILLAAGALLLFGSVLTAGQRARRATAAVRENPVAVSRSATLRIAIASDTVGIFSYLSEAPKLAQWFPDQAIIEPRLGGKYHFRFKDEEGVWSGVVTEFIRGNTLGYTWLPPDEALEKAVHFKLSPQGGQTIIELTVSGFTAGSDLEKGIAEWSFYLENLKSVIEDGSDLRPARRKAARKPVRKQG